MFLFACFVAVRVIWMSFASDKRKLREGILSMLETHIVMSFLICHLIIILRFHLILTIVLHLALFHVLCLSSLMDLTISHMVLVHERISLSLDAFDMVHILIVVIVSYVGLVSLLEGLTLTLSRDIWTTPRFPRRGSRPTQPNGELKRIVKTSSGRMVKCWISKIYLTNPSMEPSTPSRPM
jgi:hypothetical protein